MIENILFLNKPANCSSFDCIRTLKRLMPKRTKIGHAGTLDPFATGLLIIALGRGATKHLGRFMRLAKQYTATARLNCVTDTLDHTGTLLAQSTDPLPTESTLRDAIEAIGTQYTQTPPAYSALKHQGTPLYELARTGKMTPEEIAAITETKKRTVTLYERTLDTYIDDTFTLTATVSHGTYIRTLMHDIAQQAGSIGATTQTLHREKIGPFSCANALNKEDLCAETLPGALHPIADIIEQLEAWTIDR